MPVSITRDLLGCHLLSQNIITKTSIRTDRRWALLMVVGYSVQLNQIVMDASS